MTEFRRQLESLKRSHRSTAYPGDLASDVPLNSARRLPRLSVALAAAACIALGLFLSHLFRPGVTAPRTVVVAPKYHLHQLPAMPPVPHVALSLPSMPPFPALDDLTLAYEEFESTEPHEPEDL